MSSPEPTGDLPAPNPVRGALSPRSLRLLAFSLSVILLAAAVFALAGHRDELAHSWSAARAAPVWLVLAIVFLPLLNWAITSAMFWTLTRRFGNVGPWEMSALIGSAWLLNMLPLKPGLVGRIAYHKAISGIPIATSLLVTVTALLSGGVGIVIALAAQLAFDPQLRSIAPPAVLFPAAALVLALALIPGLLIAWRNRSVGRPAFCAGGAIAIAIALRVADTHVWAVRYFLAFMLIAHDQPYGVCVVVAAVSQIAGQSPIPLGFREWAVGVSSGVLRPGGQAIGAAAAVPGLTVDIVCRAAEICCALPVGIVSTLWIFRQLRRKAA